MLPNRTVLFTADTGVYAIFRSQTPTCDVGDGQARACDSALADAQVFALKRLGALGREQQAGDGGGLLFMGQMTQPIQADDCRARLLPEYRGYTVRY